jgi:hypothetical protein
MGRENRLICSPSKGKLRSYHCPMGERASQWGETTNAAVSVEVRTRESAMTDSVHDDSAGLVWEHTSLPSR